MRIHLRTYTRPIVTPHARRTPVWQALDSNGMATLKAWRGWRWRGTRKHLSHLRACRSSAISAMQPHDPIDLAGIPNRDQEGMVTFLLLLDSAATVVCLCELTQPVGGHRFQCDQYLKGHLRLC